MVRKRRDGQKGRIGDRTSLEEYTLGLSIGSRDGCPAISFFDGNEDR